MLSIETFISRLMALKNLHMPPPKKSGVLFQRINMKANK